MSSDKRHVAFNESPSFGLGTIDVALEKGAEAVAQGANKVASYIPGMAAHELKKQEDQLKAQNIDYHVADDIAYTRGPSYKADPASDTPFQHHTADEIAFVHGPSDSPSAPEESPKKDMIHTADDIEFVKGNIVSFPGRKKAEAAVAEHCRADDVHTADDLAFGGKIEGGATGVLAPPPAHPQASEESGKLRDVHTADDIAFGGLEG